MGRNQYDQGGGPAPSPWQDPVLNRMDRRPPFSMGANPGTGVNMEFGGGLGALRSGAAFSPAVLEFLQRRDPYMETHPEDGEHLKALEAAGFTPALWNFLLQYGPRAGSDPGLNTFTDRQGDEFWDHSPRIASAGQMVPSTPTPASAPTPSVPSPQETPTSLIQQFLSSRR